MQSQHLYTIQDSKHNDRIEQDTLKLNSMNILTRTSSLFSLSKPPVYARIHRSFVTPFQAPL